MRNTGKSLVIPSNMRSLLFAVVGMMPRTAILRGQDQVAQNVDGFDRKTKEVAS